MYKILKNSLKELSIAVLILAISKQLIYYTNFNLPIKFFFGFSELWMIISSDLLPMSPLILSIFIMTNGFIELAEHQVKNRPKRSYDDLIEKILMLLYILCIIISIIIFLISHSYVQKIMMVTMFFIFFISLLSHIYYKEHPSEYKLQAYLFPILALLFYLGFSSTLEISATMHGKYTGTIVKTKDSTYTSNDSTFFIGKSDRYVFIYSKKDSSTLVIPSESVLEYKIKLKQYK